MPVSVVSTDSYTVEAAEEKLVNATEEAINLMRSVLENVRPSTLSHTSSLPLRYPDTSTADESTA